MSDEILQPNKTLDQIQQDSESEQSKTWIEEINEAYETVHKIDQTYEKIGDLTRKEFIDRYCAEEKIQFVMFVHGKRLLTSHAKLIEALKTCEDALSRALDECGDLTCSIIREALAQAKATKENAKNV